MTDPLTPAQRAAIPAHVAHWTGRGLCTDPADRPAAEDALRRCYAFAGLDAPEIRWAQNPGEIPGLLEGAGDSAWGTVWGAVWGAVGDDVWGAVEDAVGGAVWGAGWDSVGDSMWDSMGDAVGDAMQDAVWDAYDGGQTWAAWPAMTSYVRDVMGVELAGDLWDRARALEDLRSNCASVLMYRNVAIMIERPVSFDPLTWRK